MRRPIAIACLVLTITCAAVPRPARSAELNGLDFAMTTDKKLYKAGEPVRVSFTWTNVGVVTLVIPEWRGPTVGVTGSGQSDTAIRDFAVYYEGGEMVPYQGPFSCGVAPELRLESKTSVTHSYDISRVYGLQRAGRYVLRAAYFGYGADDPTLGHWRGQIVHPDVEIWIHE